jgi:uncharacterized membrane protein
MQNNGEFLKRLAAELEIWRQEQIVTDAQASAIRRRYSLPPSADANNRLAYILAFLGATLLGIGIIVFFAANWPVIPGWAKVITIFAAVAASYSAGFRLRYETTAFQGTGNALLFLGALLFGAAIFLIAQGLHINANAPSLLLLWGIGVLPLAYLLGSRAMLVLVLLNLAIALGWEVGQWTESMADFFAVYLVFGVLLYGLSLLHVGRKTPEAYRVPYGVLGLLLIVGSCFPFTFDFGFHEGISGKGAPAALVIRFVLLLGITASVLLTALALAHRRDSASPTALPEIAALLILLIIGGLLFFVGVSGTAVSVLFNLLLFVLSIGIIGVGYLIRESEWVNVGTLAFALQVVARYFDWFWNLMPRALFFIGAGTLLLLGGIALERARRRVLAKVREEG